MHLGVYLLTSAILCSLFSSVASSPEKQKLLKWIEENSEVFMLLKHWNDLPLISTAWKRLKSTPQVQEDRKNFLKNVEYFLEISQDKEPVNKDSEKVSTSPVRNSTASSANTFNDTIVVDKYATTQRSNETLINIPANLAAPGTNLSSENKFTATSSISSSTPNQEDKRSYCNCTDAHFSSTTFLEEYEKEKQWIRSQLTPLNYLFDKLRSIEENFLGLQKIPCLTGNNESAKLNLSTNEALVSGNSSEFQTRINNLETISKTFSSEFHNLSSMVMSIQESTKAATKNLEVLIKHASSLSLSQRNDTEDVEYCPERLDEMVPCAEVGNSCYCFSKIQRNWTSAKEYCKTNDMFLLSLETESETELIGNYIKNSGLPKDFYWTSGSDEVNEGQWVWTSLDQNVTFENWRSNNPDGGLKENCLYLHSRDEFKWGDWICSIPQYFICEW